METPGSELGVTWRERVPEGAAGGKALSQPPVWGGSGSREEPVWQRMGGGWLWGVKSQGQRGFFWPWWTLWLSGDLTYILKDSGCHIQNKPEGAKAESEA